MAVPKLSSTIMLPCRRRLTRTQIRAGNKQRASSHVTIHDPRSLMDLPRELRDEIFRLVVQDDVDPTRDADLKYLDPVRPPELSPKSLAVFVSRQQTSTGLERSVTTAHTTSSKTHLTKIIAAVTN